MIANIVSNQRLNDISKEIYRIVATLMGTSKQGLFARIAKARPAGKQELRRGTDVEAGLQGSVDEQSETVFSMRDYY